MDAGNRWPPKNTSKKTVDDYDISIKKQAINMNESGQPVFEIATQLKVPVPLLVKWIRNKRRILKAVRRSKKVKPGDEKYPKATYLDLCKPRKQFPETSACIRNTIEIETGLKDGETPFVFEYDIPYKRKVMIDGRLKEVRGIVPKPKEDLFIDLFDEKYYTIKDPSPPPRKIIRRKPRACPATKRTNIQNKDNKFEQMLKGLLEDT